MQNGVDAWKYGTIWQAHIVQRVQQKNNSKGWPVCLEGMQRSGAQQCTNHAQQIESCDRRRNEAMGDKISQGCGYSHELGR